MNGGSNTATQNSQSNPTKQITTNFLGDSYAHCPFALNSRQLRSKGTDVLRAGISRSTTFHLTAPNSLAETVSSQSCSLLAE
ncbi:hypothetical protein PUN28_004750 [Cardiocondyla obscurior]|uniref:Uncharacterized protein n=1 Tax=Cardiocondyla obscurior TaxID=286306 RepID=A0AAW2GHF4_9HYME